MSNEDPSAVTPFDGASPATDISAPSTAPPAAPKKHSYIADGFKNRTAGEAMFNLGAYAGVGYLGVTAFSVFMSWLLRDNKFVSKYYNGMVEGAIKATKGNRTGEALTKYASTVDSNMTIAALFTGGTLMSVLPIKWLEDHKAKLVRDFDHMFYGDDKADSNATIVAAHADLAAAPKQTWKSVIGARVLAFAATFGTSLLMGSNHSPLGKATGHSLDSYAIKSGRWLDSALNHAKPEIIKTIDAAAAAHPVDMTRGGAHPDRVATRVFSYITLDAFYTLITSGALYVFTRILAPMFDNDIKARKQEEARERLIAPSAPAPAPDIRVASAATSDAPQATIQQAEAAGRIAVASQQEVAV